MRRASRQKTDGDGWDWTDRKRRTRRLGGPPKAGEGKYIKRRLAKQRRRIAALETVCGEAYQFAGNVGAPARVLDTLAAAASGRPIPHESILPISRDECEP